MSLYYNLPHLVISIIIFDYDTKLYGVPGLFPRSSPAVAVRRTARTTGIQGTKTTGHSSRSRIWCGVLFENTESVKESSVYPMTTASMSELCTMSSIF